MPISPHPSTTPQRQFYSTRPNKHHRGFIAWKRRTLWTVQQPKHGKSKVSCFVKGVHFHVLAYNVLWGYDPAIVWNTTTSDCLLTEPIVNWFLMYFQNFLIWHRKEFQILGINCLDDAPCDFFDISFFLSEALIHNSEQNNIERSSFTALPRRKRFVLDEFSDQTGFV